MAQPKPSTDIGGESYMAGMGMRDIKRKIKSINSTKQITKAMELVSTAKLKRARDRLGSTRPYFETVTRTVQDIFKDSAGMKHEFIDEREVQKTLYIVITADRGLCGGYNINAIKKALEDIEDKGKAAFITIGSKARDYFTKRNYEVIEEYTGISEKPEFKYAKEIGQKAIELFKAGEIDEVKLIYTKFVSTISQEPKLLKLLPASEEADDVEKKEEEEFKYVEYEPSPAVVLDYLIPKYIEGTIFGGMIESSASEQAARRVAMESASDNAEEMIGDLTLSFNQARQAAITQEITEIVGGAEALK